VVGGTSALCFQIVNKLYNGKNGFLFIKKSRFFWIHSFRRMVIESTIFYIVVYFTLHAYFFLQYSYAIRPLQITDNTETKQ
jgi:hypothetical protein